MILNSLIFLILSNSITSRRDKSILYSRIVITILLISTFIAYVNLSLLFLAKGIGIFGGLFHNTATTYYFHIFIFIIACFVLLLTSFYPRKVWLKDYSSPNRILFTKLIYYGTLLTNKMWEQFKIVEYYLIILFIVTGSVFLISTSDLVSIFLFIELQSYGLYLLSTIYRDSEPATYGGLMYFLLGGFWILTFIRICIMLFSIIKLLKLKISHTLSYRVIMPTTVQSINDIASSIPSGPSNLEALLLAKTVPLPPTELEALLLAKTVPLPPTELEALISAKPVGEMMRNWNKLLGSDTLFKPIHVENMDGERANLMLSFARETLATKSDKFCLTMHKNFSLDIHYNLVDASSFCEKLRESTYSELHSTHLANIAEIDIGYIIIWHHYNVKLFDIYMNYLNEMCPTVTYFNHSNISEIKNLTVQAS